MPGLIEIEKLSDIMKLSNQLIIKVVVQISNF